MSAPIVAFFNNKGGVGKTSLVYHLAWMFSDLGVRVLAADLDPQANLTAAFFTEDYLETLWDVADTIFTSVHPLIQRKGDIKLALPYDYRPNLHIILGDLRLAGFEDLLATGWGECRGGQSGGFVVISAFSRLLKEAAAQYADIVLVDLGPNLGAINRAALIAADYLVVPLAPDLFSLQGMKNLGPTIRGWIDQWKKITSNEGSSAEWPQGRIQPIGYVVQQHSVRLDRPVKSYEKWIARIPVEYRKSVLGESLTTDAQPVDRDPSCLALLKHYHSLMPMALEARKPMFHLKVADGAIGAHLSAAQDAGKLFRRLAKRIAERVDVKLP